MKITEQFIKELLVQGENRTLEMKKCKDTLPESVWETVSAFANTRGGVILLGVVEHKEKPLSDKFEINGVADANKVVTDFFNMLNNPQKINRSVLVDSDVRIVEIDGKDVIYINVPEADYRQKPIFINQKLERGTFKRGHEGDRRVNKEELALLLRDSSDDVDSQIIEYYGMDDIDAETLRKYRQAFKTENPGHAYVDLADRDFLIKMGGYDINRKTGTEGLTMAGLLMFGQSQHIHKNFPNFRVDYLDLIDIEPGDSKKWNDRLTDDGRWEDNLYNFLILTLRKLLFTLPSEGKLNGVIRHDGGQLHEAVREAFINSITYCDYLLGGVLRIDRRTDRIVMRNPGTLRIPSERIYNGDYTQARNSTIQKMLRMIGFGDNIGSGFQKIMKVWKTLGYGSPDIHQEDDVNEVWLTLPLTAAENVTNSLENVTNSLENVTNSLENVTNDTKNVTNTSENVTKDEEDVTNSPENVTKTDKRRDSVLEILKSNGSVTTEEIAEKLNVSKRTILRDLDFLSKANIIKREGGSFGGKWVVNQ